MMGGTLVTFGEGEMIPGIPPPPQRPIHYETNTLTRIPRRYANKRHKEPIFVVQSLRLRTELMETPLPGSGGVTHGLEYRWVPEAGGWFETVSRHRSFSRAAAELRRRAA